jgi:hypothetical protein
MGSPELAKMADFYADLTGRFALTDSLALWRDSSERLHQLATEPEDVTSRENGVPALWVIPVGPVARRDRWSRKQRTTNTLKLPFAAIPRPLLERNCYAQRGCDDRIRTA